MNDLDAQARALLARADAMVARGTPPVFAWAMVGIAEHFAVARGPCRTPEERLATTQRVLSFVVAQMRFAAAHPEVAEAWLAGYREMRADDGPEADSAMAEEA